MRAIKCRCAALFFLLLTVPIAVAAETYRSDALGGAGGGSYRPSKPAKDPVNHNIIYTIPKRNDRGLGQLLPKNMQFPGNRYDYEIPRRKADDKPNYEPLNPFVIRW